MPHKSYHEKHIHLQTKTDYIAKLIGRAEPELLGRYVLSVVNIYQFVYLYKVSAYSSKCTFNVLFLEMEKR